MSIILRVDGLLGKMAGTVYGGQVRIRSLIEEWGESLISAVIEVTAKVIKHNQGAVPGITGADDSETLKPEQLYINDPAEFSLLESEFGEDLVLVFLKYAEQEYGRNARKLPTAGPPGAQPKSHIRKDNFGTIFNNPKLERFFETGEL